MTLDIEAALRTWLLARQEITSHVGQQIFPDALEQDCEWPVVLLEETDGEEGQSLRGQGNGLHRETIRISVFSDRIAQARQIRELLEAAMSDLPRETIGKVFVNGLTLGPREKGLYQPNDKSAKFVYVRGFEVDLTYSAAVQVTG